MKIFFTLMLFLTLSCATASKVSGPTENVRKPEVVDLTPPPQPRNVFSGDLWEISVPVNSGWKRLITDDAEIVLIDKEAQMLLTLERVHFDKSLSEFADQNRLSVEAAGIEITDRYKDIVNGKETHIFYEKVDDAVCFQWLFVYEKIGYTLMCGGKADNFASNLDACTQIVSKFYINK